MKRFLLGAAVVGAVLASLSGCSRPALKRAKPGDTVTPEIELPAPWQAGKPASLLVRLRAQGAGDPESVLLQDEEVGSEPTGLASITFYNGDQPLEEIERTVRHDC